jgi:hypothetical protein
VRWRWTLRLSSMTSSVGIGIRALLRNPADVWSDGLTNAGIIRPAD